MHFHKNTDKMKILNFTDSCGIVCEISESTGGGSAHNFVIFIMVDNKTFQYPVSNKRIQNITCRINTAGCCSKYHCLHLHILNNKICVLFANN